MLRSTLLAGSVLAASALAAVVLPAAPASADTVCVQVLVTTPSGTQNLGPCFDPDPQGLCDDTEAMIGLTLVVVRVCVQP
jgi:hypothetical protein